MNIRHPKAYNCEAAEIPSTFFGRHHETQRQDSVHVNVKEHRKEDATHGFANAGATGTSQSEALNRTLLQPSQKNKLAELSKVQIRQTSLSESPKLRSMKIFARCLVLLMCWVATLAVAQWQWLDPNGRSVFSDRAPPLSVPDKAIVKRPGAALLEPASHVADAPETGTAAPTRVAASAPKAIGLDKDLQQKKKQVEAQAADRLKADEQHRLAAKADNCQRAKSAKAGLDSGLRLSRTNAKGEPEILDDTARAAEGKRIQSVIDSDCK